MPLSEDLIPGQTHRGITAAWQGAWRSILEAIKGQQAADQEQLLCQAAYYTLALIKLRNYPAANAEILKLGDFDSAHLTKASDDGRHDSSPSRSGMVFLAICVSENLPAAVHTYDTHASPPGTRVSMVPFALRWLQADMHEQPDRMYQLLDYCTQQLEADANLAATMKSLRATQRLHSISLQDADFAAGSDQPSMPQSSQERHVQMWARRQHMVICNLVNRHVRYLQVPALSHVQRL